MTDQGARDRREQREAAGRARRAKLDLEPLERPSRPGRPVTPGGTQPQGGKYDEAAIDREAGGKRGQPPGSHATDLRNALRMHYGFSFEVRDKLLEGGSRNMLRLRLACLARRDPVAAAKVVVTWFGAELFGGVAGTRERWWGDDELLSGNYESWSALGTLLTLKELAESQGRFSGEENRLFSESISYLRRDLARTQALYALLARPGVVRNLQGRESYSGPVVWCAGLRSIARREGNNARTPVAAALLGGVQYVGDPGPLAAAIGELAEAAALGPHRVYALTGKPMAYSQLWREAVGVARRALEGTRTMLHFRAAIYHDGTKMSCLLGPKGASSTAEVRLVVVRGPEIKDAIVVTPHAEGDERTVPASDAWIDEGRTFVTGTVHNPRGFSEQLPAGEPVVQLDLRPDAEPAWSGTAVRA